MLDLKFVLKNKKTVIKELSERKMEVCDFSKLSAMEDKRKEIMQQVDYLRKQKKILSEQFENIVNAKQKIDENIHKKLKDINVQLRNEEGNLNLCKEEINSFLNFLPNLAHSSVPQGFPGKPNTLISKNVKKTKFNFQPKTYLELAEKLKIIDFPNSYPIFNLDIVFYKNLGAKIYRAIIDFLLDRHSHGGCHELSPSVLADGYPVLKLLRGAILNEDELPLSYCSHSFCFRKDWNYAEDIKNLKRIKQFDSVEVMKLVKSKDSYLFLENLREDVESILQDLDLPYEVYLFNKGNLDYIASKAYSIKVFLPGLNNFLEIAVCSNLSDFFTKDLNIRIKNEKEKNLEYAHVLHAKSLIINRVMMAILENYQQSDGSVIIPRVLKPYLNNLGVIN